jgi:hypothetical protein
VRNDFGVAVGDESMSTRLEIASLLDVIEQFAVENDRYALVFIRDRLLAIRQPDDMSRRARSRDAGKYPSSGPRCTKAWAIL